VGFVVYQKFFRSPYGYTLAEFVQKQQTFSPFTKYEPSFVVDQNRGKLYFVYKAMDEEGVWQIWTAEMDFDGNGWKEIQQTNTAENKQRPSVIYDPQGDLLYYFYRTGSDRGAAEKIPRYLVVASKKVDEEKWSNERTLTAADGVDDTVVPVLDSKNHQILLAYTKNSQITTARLNLDTGEFAETVHTASAEMSFIPHAAFDETSGIFYLVFPRARTAGSFDNKDLWLARVKSDGSHYQETRLTETNFDNTWPFITLDVARQKFYVSYSSFSEPTTYSAEGVGAHRERLNLGADNFDGSGFKLLRDKNGLRIMGINPESGVLYGLYEKPYQTMPQGEGNERYFVVFDPAKNKFQTQLIPSGDRLTDYDAGFLHYVAETRKIFGAQQVCRPAEERGMECQIWTYHGRVLEGEKSKLAPQTEALVAPSQPRELPALKLLRAEALTNKIQFNTNRKLSMPVWFTIKSGDQEIKWEPSWLEPIDQDRGVQLRFPQNLSVYTVTYKICALTDPEKGEECLEGALTFPE
jgi:hypothetical protein